MLSLLPAESWEYNFSDVFRSLATTTLNRKPTGLLTLDGVGDCLPIRSARAGIALALRVLNLPKNAKVGVPLYTCPVVFKSIVAEGLQPCFIDIDAETGCLSAHDLSKKASDLQAIIAIHMFGNLCDIPALRQTSKKIPIVEDCAQALGSRLNGQMVGTLGDIAVFSFRSGKYLSVGEGGAIYSSDKILFNQLEKLVSSLPYPNLNEEYLHVIKTYLRSKLRSRPLWGMVGNRLWSSYNKSTDFTEKTPIVMAQMYRSDSTLTRHRLAKLKQQIAKQRNNAEYFANKLNLTGCTTFKEPKGAFYNRYLYPILFRSPEDRDKIAHTLLKQNITTIQPYKDIPAQAAAHYGYTGDCPVSERIAKNILVMPSYHSLNQEELVQISEAFNAAQKFVLSPEKVAA